MPLPNILADQKSNNFLNFDDENKSFRTKIAENINFTRLAKEIELNQSQNNNTKEKEIIQNTRNKKVINLNYKLDNPEEDEEDEVVTGLTKKLTFNKSNKYKNKASSIVNNELFKLNDNGNLVKLVKMPEFKSSQKSARSSCDRNSRVDFNEFDDFEKDDDDEVIFSSSTATPIISSRSSNSGRSSFLNIDNISKYKQKK